MELNYLKVLFDDMVKAKLKAFPGGAVVTGPSANVGDTGSGPGPGGSRVPRSG